MTPALKVAISGAVGVLAAVASASSALAADAPHVNGAELAAPWAVPFVGLLLSIAVLPLAAPKLWHHHYGKIAAAWALAFVAPFAAIYGAEIAIFEFLHVMLLDYVPFIVLLFSLYTISGGVLLEGHLKGTPWTNASMLAGGTAIASIAGTTGASAK